jgi:CheY-like chemotaxis protein
MDDEKMVLVLEADRTLQDSVRKVVEREGYRVVTARSLGEARSLLTRIARPCMILLDTIINGEAKQVLGDEYPMATIPVRVSAQRVRRMSKRSVHIDELVQMLARHCRQASSS